MSATRFAAALVLALPLLSGCGRDPNITLRQKVAEMFPGSEITAMPETGNQHTDLRLIVRKPDGSVWMARDHTGWDIKPIAVELFPAMKTQAEGGRQ